MKKYIYCTIAIIFILCSCSDNSFYVDTDNQCIIRCNNQSMQIVSIYLAEKIVNKISLEPLDGKNFYLIKYIGHEINRDNNIYLMKTNKNYEVFFNDTLVPNGIISLRANTKYNIVHRSNGDSTPFSILVETNKKGLIVKSGISNCK